MKKLLPFLFVAFLNSLEGQVKFCPSGAQWRYFFHDYVGNLDKDASMSYIGDTIVGADTIKIIRYYSFFKVANGGFCGSVWIKQKGDTVFMRTCNTSGTWQILYNYACLPGQYWINTVKDSAYYGNHSPVTYTTTINSVSTVTLNNFSLKKLKVTTCYFSLTNGSLQCDTSSIYERIGGVPYLFYFVNYPPPSWDEAEFTNFLCYKDNAFGQHDFVENGCNMYVGIKEYIFNSNVVRVYPIPTKSNLSIDFENMGIAHSFNSTFYDVSGREAKQIKLEQSTNKLDISELEDGLYLLKIEDPVTKLNYQIKVVKQR